ncbi:MAG: S41 family peptidase [Bacteroidetes bacterium]|nr:S41 family peptidase [Bacteroidota bacterium]MDA1119183.1 S41 family peptidase [Bacteroidota bacterium]
MSRIKKIIVGSLLGVVMIGLFAFNSIEDRYFEIAKNLDIFATLFKEVNAFYVDEINPNELVRTGINAMLNSLDPYTDYIPEDDIENYRTMTTGQYGGIGALVGKRGNYNTIIMPYEGYPAHEAGLQIGDQIIKINNINLENKKTDEISKLLKGQSKTEINLTIQRYGAKETFDILLKREKITINNVPYYGMINNHVGFIKLSDFTTDAGKEVRDALAELKGKGASKLILDLRGNPGGLLDEAINVSNVFVAKGAEIVSTKGKVTSWNKTYTAPAEPVDIELPLAVLTSSGSASAAEIVAGVIQDYDRGVLVGRKTYGKGLVQATRPLSYNSQLKITTAKYYIPSGRCIQAIDYSNRNEDGSVGRMPDSLKVAFETRNGRTVYDGGGVDPDVAVNEIKFASITIALITKNLLFDYATKYHYEHKTIANPNTFKLADEEYLEFGDWLSDKDLTYETSVERTLGQLEKAAKEERYYDDIKAELDSFSEAAEKNKEDDLQRFKEEISYVLEEEIVSRYYLESGIVEASFDNDSDILAAIEVLEDSERYQNLLKGE